MILWLRAWDGAGARRGRSVRVFFPAFVKENGSPTVSSARLNPPCPSHSYRRRGFRYRAPKPPPFSSKNSIPAASIAFCNLKRISCGVGADFKSALARDLAEDYELSKLRAGSARSASHIDEAAVLSHRLKFAVWPLGRTSHQTIPLDRPRSNSAFPAACPTRLTCAATPCRGLEEYMSGLSDRSSFIGGSDARVIMGEDEAALVRLWREKRGEVRAGGPLRQPDRPARHRYRGPQPALVRAQHRADDQARAAPDPAPRHQMDGRDPRRPG